MRFTPACCNSRSQQPCMQIRLPMHGFSRINTRALCLPPQLLLADKTHRAQILHALCATHYGCRKGGRAPELAVSEQGPTACVSCCGSAVASELAQSGEARVGGRVLPATVFMCLTTHCDHSVSATTSSLNASTSIRWRYNVTLPAFTENAGEQSFAPSVPSPPSVTRPLQCSGPRFLRCGR